MTELILKHDRLVILGMIAVIMVSGLITYYIGERRSKRHWKNVDKILKGTIPKT
jgi:hypothetical protein